MSKRTFNLISASALATAFATANGGEAEEEVGAAPESVEEPEAEEEVEETEAGGDDKKMPGDDKKMPGKDKDMEDDDEGADAAQSVVTVDTAMAVANNRYDEGVAAERKRTEAVLSSDAGKANVSNAGFLLAHSDASAEKIISQLEGAAPVSKAAEIEETSVDLGVGTDPIADANTGDRNEDDGWGKALDTVSAQNGFIVPEAAQKQAVQADAAGAKFVTTQSGY